MCADGTIAMLSDHRWWKKGWIQAWDRATITRSLLPYNMHDGESLPVEIGWMTLSVVA